MAAPPEVRQTHVMGTGDGLKFTELFGRLLDWVKQHRSPDTYVWYQYRLQRFAARLPELTVEQLRRLPAVRRMLEMVRDPTVRIAAVSNTQTRACVGRVKAGANALVTFSIAAGNLIIGASLLGDGLVCDYPNTTRRKLFL